MMDATSKIRNFAAKRSVKLCFTVLLILSACTSAVSSACCLLLADYSAYSNEGGGFVEGITDTLLERDAESIWDRLYNKNAWQRIPTQKDTLPELPSIPKRLPK